MNVAFKKLTVAVALASLVATGSLAAATPAAAGWGWRHGGGLGLPRRRLGRSSRRGASRRPCGRRDRRRGQSTRLLRRSLLPGEPPGDRRLGQRRRLSTHAGLRLNRECARGRANPSFGRAAPPLDSVAARFRDLFGVGASRHCNRRRASL